MQRLARQRKIVQDRHQHTIVTKSKADICESKFEKFVILPDDTATFEEWWTSLDDDDDIQVQQELDAKKHAFTLVSERGYNGGLRRELVGCFWEEFVGKWKQ